MFFYFKIISVFLLPQALPLCTLRIILPSSLWLFGVLLQVLSWQPEKRIPSMGETSGLAFYSRAPEFYFLPSVLVLGGKELTSFLTTGAVLRFGLRLRILLVPRCCSSCC